MSTELKPCPFCGGVAELIEGECGMFQTAFAVYCVGECHAKIGISGRLNETYEWTPIFGTAAEAAEAWNRRAERTCRAWQDYEAMEDGMPDCRMWRCECGETFPFWRGLDPTYCPNCGAKVAE